MYGSWEVGQLSALTMDVCHLRHDFKLIGIQLFKKTLIISFDPSLGVLRNVLNSEGSRSILKIYRQWVRKLFRNWLLDLLYNPFCLKKYMRIYWCDKNLILTNVSMYYIQFKMVQTRLLLYKFPKIHTKLKPIIKHVNRVSRQ